MIDEKIERINFLARKSKSEGLSQEELNEQAQLRREYIDSYKKNLEQTLKSVVVVDEDGNKRKLNKK